MNASQAERAKPLPYGNYRAELTASEKVPFGRYPARCDVLEYCPSGLGDTHEATAVHYVFRCNPCRQYTIVVASRAGALSVMPSGALPSSAKPDDPANGLIVGYNFCPL